MNLLDQIKDAGIIGAGGAGFPTHAKLTSEAEYILMNGAECEPLLRVDQQLMAIYPDEIIKGFAEAGRLVNAKKAIIGIKSKHGEVIELLKERIKALQLDGAGLADLLNLLQGHLPGEHGPLRPQVPQQLYPRRGVKAHLGGGVKGQLGRPLPQQGEQSPQEKRRLLCVRTEEELAEAIRGILQAAGK